MLRASLPHCCPPASGAASGSNAAAPPPRSSFQTAVYYKLRPLAHTAIPPPPPPRHVRCRCRGLDLFFTVEHLLLLGLVVENAFHDLLLLDQERPDDALAHAISAPATATRHLAPVTLQPSASAHTLRFNPPSPRKSGALVQRGRATLGGGLRAQRRKAATRSAVPTWRLRKHASRASGASR